MPLCKCFAEATDGFVEHGHTQYGRDDGQRADC